MTGTARAAKAAMTRATMRPSMLSAARKFGRPGRARRRSLLLCLRRQRQLAAPAARGDSCRRLLCRQACWKTTKTGYKYKDKASPGSINVAVLKSSVNGRQALREGGCDLRTALGLTTPLVVSSIATTVVRAGRHSTTQRNDARQVKAKSDPSPLMRGGAATGPIPTSWGRHQRLR
jgi:hypothetical protein